MKPLRLAHLLSWCLALNLLAQVTIKYVDVWASWDREPRPVATSQSSYDGVWERGPKLRDRIVQPLLQRGYNVVFWIQVSVTLACWRFRRAAVDANLLLGASGPRRGSAWIVPLLALGYVVTVALEPGTFFARRPATLSRVMQRFEGGLNLLVIYAAWESARLGATLAAAMKPKAPVPLGARRLIVDGASAPFWGLATYCLVYPLVIAERLRNDEVMAMLGTLVCYVLPHWWVIRMCRKNWGPRFRVEFMFRSPFGPHVVAESGAEKTLEEEG